MIGAREVVDAAGANLKPLGSPHDYGYFGYLTGRRYEVSPDGEHVLGADVEEFERAELFLVRTADGGRRCSPTTSSPTSRSR